MTAKGRLALPSQGGDDCRILLASTGTLGDVYPFVAVALALRAWGCTPVIAAMEQYRGDVEAAGIAFRPVRPGRAELEADGLDDALFARAVARDQRAGFAFAAPHLAATVADLTAAMAGCSAVVAGSLSVATRIVAEAAGLPVITLVLQPTGFLSRTDPPVLREAPWLGAVSRRCGPSAVAALYRVGNLRARPTLRPFVRLRATFGLPPVRDELYDGARRGRGMIALYPTCFAPLPRDVPAQTIGAGFSYYNGPQLPLSPALARFLAEGPPPLVFTLGSFVVHAAGDFYAAAAAVPRRLGRRAVLLVGRHAVDRHAGLAGPDILVADQAPHALLFPHAAAVVHHGGIGTTAQALRAGLAQLACPFFGDQFDNAAHLERLDVAATLPLARFIPDRAATLLAALLESPAAHRAIGTLACAVSQEDGPARAAEIIAATVRSSAVTSPALAR